MPDLPVVAPVDCPTCHGASTVDPDPDCPTCEGHGEVSAPADPVVSPADTIRRAINYTSGNVIRAKEAHDALDALLAERERDRQHIARLTEARSTLLRWCDEGGGKYANYIATADIRAVLAVEEGE